MDIIFCEVSVQFSYPLFTELVSIFYGSERSSLNILYQRLCFLFLIGCSRQVMFSGQRLLVLIPRTGKYVTLCDQKDLANVIKLRALRWGGCPGFCKAQCSHRSPSKQRPFPGCSQGGVMWPRKLCQREVMSLALRLVEGATSQGTPVASRGWKRQDNRFFLRTPEGTSPADNLLHPGRASNCRTSR